MPKKTSVKRARQIVASIVTLEKRIAKLEVERKKMIDKKKQIKKEEPGLFDRIFSDEEE